MIGDVVTESFRERVARLAAQGKSRAQQAAAMGMTRASFYRRLEAEGMTRKHADHSAAIPWAIGEAHNKDTETQYLRELSATAQGRGPISRHHRNTALRWASDLIDAELDITFDSGWRTVPADPSNWHIKRVYLAALEGLENE